MSYYCRWNFLSTFFYYKNYWGCIVISKDFQINENIRDQEIRVIDENGKMIGILSSKEALNMAISRNLDLVKVSPNAKPPLCKILDFGKFKYEQSRREKEAKKKQKTINIKEIRMSARVEEHDQNVKAKNCRKFLLNGDRVKASVRFRGREMAYTDIGVELLLKFADKVSDVGTIDKKPKLEGRNMVMFLVSKKDK